MRTEFNSGLSNIEISQNFDKSCLIEMLAIRKTGICLRENERNKIGDCKYEILF